MKRLLLVGAIGFAFSFAFSGCSAVLDPSAPLQAADCFGDVPYSFAGWTTLDAIKQEAEPGVDRVYALVTRDEIVLTNSPVNPDGTSSRLIGRGACWTIAGGDSVTKSAFGASRWAPNR